MAYHEVAMWEILTVLERLTRRESKTAVARATGHSRSTVRRYERVARELGGDAGRRGADLSTRGRTRTAAPSRE